MNMMTHMQFVHRGCDDGRPLLRQKSTITGGMLASPFRRDTCEYPPEPPRVFQTRAAVSERCILFIYSFAVFTDRLDTISLSGCRLCMLSSGLRLLHVWSWTGNT